MHGPQQCWFMFFVPTGGPQPVLQKRKSHGNLASKDRGPILLEPGTRQCRRGTFKTCTVPLFCFEKFMELQARSLDNKMENTKTTRRTGNRVCLIFFCKPLFRGSETVIFFLSSSTCKLQAESRRNSEERSQDLSPAMLVWNGCSQLPPPGDPL